ncbi:hypothetical protein KAT60_01225 [Candidatus Woesebacteria bacterium]|nr:hypothetical protein [Candidatus Woesebacteria bacterium]
MTDRVEETEAHKVDLPPKKEFQKIDRRSFLKIMGLGVAAGLASTLLPDTDSNTAAGNLISRGIASLITKGGEKEARVIEESMKEEADKEGNPHSQPYLEILKEGVEKFQSKNPNIQVTWEKSAKYYSDYDAIRDLMRPIRREELFEGQEKIEGKMPIEYIFRPMGEDTVAVYGIFFSRLPEEIREIVNTANVTAVALPDTRLYIEHYPENGNVFYDDDIYNYYEPIKKDLENIYGKQVKKQPLPMSRLLVYFLEKNQGKLQPSLGDMAGFLKYMVRSYWGYGTRPTEWQIDWLRIHVQDQINKNFSLNNLPVQESLSDEAKSVWGEMYHLPHIVYLLSYLSPDIVRAAVMYEYVSHSHVAEAYKTKVDAEAMDNLNAIFAYFQEFSKK